MKDFPFIVKLSYAVGLLISIQFIISSCSVKGYKPIANSEEHNSKVLYIFDGDFKKALYKTTINIYGNNLTGLTLIKKTDSAMRVVSMSELGIKYFELEFPDNKQQPFKVHYIIEPLNKEIIINKISKGFSFMFFIPDINKSRVMICNNDNSLMLLKKNKLVYFFDQSGAITEIYKQRWPFSLKQIISLLENKQSFPETINMDYGNVSFDLELIN